MDLEQGDAVDSGGDSEPAQKLRNGVAPIAAADDPGRRIGHGVQHLRAPRQLEHRLPALGQVVEAGNDGRLTAVDDRPAGERQPELAGPRPPAPDLQGVDEALRPQQFDDVVAVGGIGVELRRRPADQVGQRRAHHIGGALVGVDHLPVGDHGDRHRQRVGLHDLAQPLLHAALLLLQPVALGDVGVDGDEPTVAQLAAAELQDAPVFAHRPDGPAAGLQLDRDALARLLHRIAGSERAGLRARQQHLEEADPRAQPAARNIDELIDPAVGRNDIAGAVDRDHAVDQTVEYALQQLHGRRRALRRGHIGRAWFGGSVSRAIVSLFIHGLAVYTAPARTVEVSGPRVSPDGPDVLDQGRRRVGPGDRRRCLRCRARRCHRPRILS